MKKGNTKTIYYSYIQFYFNSKLNKTYINIISKQVKHLQDIHILN